MISHYIKTLQRLVNQHPSVVLGMLGVITFIIISSVVDVVVHHHNTPPHSVNKGNTLSAVKPTSAKVALPNPYLSRQLNDVAVKLAAIETTLSAKQPVINLDPIRASLTTLNQQLQTLARETNDLVAREVRQATQPLEQQLKKLNHAFNTLQRAQKKVRYLSPSQLAFGVVSINNIQQHDVVTVRYNHTTFPLSVGDYLVGWRLIQADFAMQTAEFVNQQQQRSRVRLNRHRIPQDTTQAIAASAVNHADNRG